MKIQKKISNLVLKLVKGRYSILQSIQYIYINFSGFGKVYTAKEIKTGKV